jgi:hypothetical protein
MVIIDAYNLLNVTGVLPAHLAGPGLVKLVALVRSSRHGGDRVLLVCDGHVARLAGRPPARSGDPVRVRFGGVDLIFSAPGTEADDVIEALLAHHAGSNGVLMVSSDRRLSRAARRVGAQPMSSEAFMKRLALDADARAPAGYPAFARKTPLDRGDVVFWMAEFGLGAPAEPGPPEPPPTPEPALAPRPAPGPPAEAPPVDELLVRLIRESRLSIDPVDLDMERWLREHPPKPYC